MSLQEDKVCPRCHIAQPDDAWPDLPVRLCRFCVADLTREGNDEAR